MDGKAARLKEKPTSIKISDICAWIETMDEALRCIQKDVSEVKDLIKKTTPLWWVQIWHRLRSLRNLSKNRLQQLLPLLVT
ncbi:hypothetical protein PAHAL_9G062200 [Panicum hallii]|uniref:Uncharacterized protein n=1 Tax=Panicum hallii TaxID=206008 RepID=A0A2T8I0E2_9POAL|nr:hypothetical protein PAHAL_9G062200 [Panicum hallii]